MQVRAVLLESASHFMSVANPKSQIQNRKSIWPFVTVSPGELLIVPLLSDLHRFPQKARFFGFRERLGFALGDGDVLLELGDSIHTDHAGIYRGVQAVPEIW